MTVSAPPPFDDFFRAQAPAVSRFLRGWMGPDDADECLQETFLAALESYDRFDGRHPTAWVLRIARRRAVDAHRAGSRRPRFSELPEEQMPAATDRVDGLDGDVWQLAAALPEKQRAALILRYALDLRYREIGIVLGCSEQAARRSGHEGLKRLRAEIEEVGADVVR